MSILLSTATGTFLSGSRRRTDRPFRLYVRKRRWAMHKFSSYCRPSFGLYFVCFFFAQSLGGCEIGDDFFHSQSQSQYGDDMSAVIMAIVHA